MSGPYSAPEPKPEKQLVRISIRLDPGEAEELQRVAEYWDALDAELDPEAAKKRRRKWSAASVMERMIRVGMADFYAQAGGRRREEESFEEFIQRAISTIRRNAQNARNKP